MSDINIQNLNLKQLSDLKKSIDLRIKQIEEEENYLFAQLMKKEAEKRGINIETVFGAPVKIPRKKLPPKYRNPGFDPEIHKAKEEFYTGAGRKPAWALAYIEEHGSLDGCLIHKKSDENQDTKIDTKESESIAELKVAEPDIKKTEVSTTVKKSPAKKAPVPKKSLVPKKTGTKTSARKSTIKKAVAKKPVRRAAPKKTARKKTVRKTVSEKVS